MHRGLNKECVIIIFIPKLHKMAPNGIIQRKTLQYFPSV